MRVIAGTSGGIPIKVPQDSTRPTTDRVREAVFSSLGNSIADASVLDLFAGSGSLGIEALSRGALSAVFVDQSKLACQIIQANLVKTSLSEKATVRTSGVERYLDGLTTNSKFNLIFADPPYARDEETRLIVDRLLNHEALPSTLHENGILVLESIARGELPATTLWTVLKQKKYGDTRVSFLSPITN